MTEEQKAEGSSEEGKAPAALEVELDGEKRQVTAQDAVSLLKEQASVTQQGQKLASVLKMAEKYGIDPKDLMEQADGAFSRIHELVEMGVLDKEGNVLVGEKGGKAKTETPLYTESPQGFTGGKEISEDRFLGIVEKALNPMAERLRLLEEDNARLVRMKVEGDLMSKHPELDAEDVARLFARTRMDRSKNIWDHAKEMAEGKKSSKQKMKEELAKELGVDLKQWNERNALKEQDAKAISAGVLGGKRVSFKKGKDTITPGAAFQEWMRRKQLLESTGG